MSKKITLYVDGACRGNPGIGGWGAYLTETQSTYYLCGGALNTTNNRMELLAAIQGILACPLQATLEIWTDSTYVKQGITEWIIGWKKRQWKEVKNTDLWKKLDEICQGREIKWHWIKGHAGHFGNEMADQLANRGADFVTTNHTYEGQILTLNSITDTSVKKIVTLPIVSLENTPISTSSLTTKKQDWLLDDPFGLDDTYNEDRNDEFVDVETDIHLSDRPLNVLQTTEHPTQTDISITESPKDNQRTKLKKNIKKRTVLTEEQIQSHIVITPATLELTGERQLILDTETTGLYYQHGEDRVIEVGAIEMINRKLTGRSIHIYIQPEKSVGDSAQIHGISDEFLQDKPIFAEIAHVLFEYLKGAELIAHNASFDMNFLDMEFEQIGYPALSSVCKVTDTLALAKAKHAGQRNSLDALVKRYNIPERDRTFHGALLDAEILADVYLAMTGGQVSLDIQDYTAIQLGETHEQYKPLQVQLTTIFPNHEEQIAHQTWVTQYAKKQGKSCLFQEYDDVIGLSSDQPLKS